MRVYHDWEFLDAGRGVLEPISVGMVAENGAELYYEFADAPWRDVFKHQWLKENVVPHLTCTKDGSLAAGVGTKTFKSRLSIRMRVYNFLQELEAIGDSRLELWGWYCAYDHVCLGQLFGKMIDLPPFVPMHTKDLKQEFDRLGQPLGQPKTEGPAHNALEDARWMLQMHKWLEQQNG